MTKPKLREMPRPDISLTSALGLPAVYVKDARKSFGDKEVLRDVSLQIGQGEVVSLIGPSGAGKSTMLRCLALLDTFDSGELAYGNVRVCANEPGSEKTTYEKAAMRQARMRFGIVFQNYNLFPHYTVLKNVMDAPIVVQKRDPKEVEEQARKLLEQLDIADHADKVPDQLSGGQQQRVAIARRGHRHARDGLRARGVRPHRVSVRRPDRGGGHAGRGPGAPHRRAHQEVPRQRGGLGRARRTVPAKAARPSRPHRFPTHAQAHTHMKRGRATRPVPFLHRIRTVRTTPPCPDGASFYKRGTGVTAGAPQSAPRWSRRPCGSGRRSTRT